MIKNPLNGLHNLADPDLELKDPAPNIYEMLHDFDLRFFDGTLLRNGVELDWSPRMTQCAGLCRWDGRIQHCSIRLSNPLLALRPRRDLLETLLHEMIHAFLFVIRESDNRESHGPKFHQIMYKINSETMLSISVYHSFHDEVNFYKTHVWRCEGVCRQHAPYYGWVRRAMNRKPGPNDTWWQKHQQTCGGQFVKISEPEKPNKPVKSKKPKMENIKSKSLPAIEPSSNCSPNKDIRQFFTPISKDNGNLNETSRSQIVDIFSSSTQSKPAPNQICDDFSKLMSPVKSNRPQIKTVFDDTHANSNLLDAITAAGKPLFVPFVGTGYTLASTSTSSTSTQTAQTAQSSQSTSKRPISRLILQFDKKCQPLENKTELKSKATNSNSIITLDDSFDNLDYSNLTNQTKRSLSNYNSFNANKKLCKAISAECITLD